MPSHPEYEYGIIYSLFPNDIHRGPFTKEEAETWVQEWLDDGGKADVFSIVRRPTGPWEPVPDEDEPTITESNEGCFPGPLSTEAVRRSWDIPEINYVNIVPKPKRWYVERVTIWEDDHRSEENLADILASGWEPFAVTRTLNGQGHTHYIRRLA